MQSTKQLEAGVPAGLVHFAGAIAGLVRFAVRFAGGLAAVLLLDLATSMAGQEPPSPSSAPAQGASEQEKYAVELLPPDGQTPSIPKEVPEAFAKRLDGLGLRIVERDGKGASKTLLEIWTLIDTPLLAPPKDAASASNVDQTRLPPGSFVGVVRVAGELADYREQAIDPGVYGLRYSQQPNDGNHLGTSDSRDFFVLTSFAHEKSPEPLAKEDDLMAVATPISPSDHALVLYVSKPPEAPAKDGAPRIFRRGDKEEWAIELVLKGTAPDRDQVEGVPVGLVFVGHTVG